MTIRRDIFPICTGPCSNWSQRQIAEALWAQRDHMAVIRERISRHRLATMSPQSMREELDALGRQIAAARASLGRVK